MANQGIFSDQLNVNLLPNELVVTKSSGQNQLAHTIEPRKAHTAFPPTGRSCTSAISYPTPITVAHELLDIGISVFPLPYGQKSPVTEEMNADGNLQYHPSGKPITVEFPWKRLGFTRNLLLASSAKYIFAGRCNLAVVVGRVSGNLLISDCETLIMFDRVKLRLRQQGIPIFTVKTGGGGGHLYLRCIDGEVQNVSLQSGIFTDMEIRGHDLYAVAPSSVHPETGEFYKWDVQECVEPPALSLAQIQALFEPLLSDQSFRFKLNNRNPKRVNRHGEDSRYNKLSFNTRHFLESGAPQGQRNQSLFNAACDMYGCGYTQSEVERIAGTQAAHCDLSQQEIIDTINSAFSIPRTPARSYHDGKQPEDWHAVTWRAQVKAQALVFAKTHNWGKGKSASTDRKIFDAFTVRVENGGYPDKYADQLIFRASVAELGEIAHVSNPNTVVKAIRRLKDAGLIAQRGTDRYSGARLWQFGERVLGTRKRSTTSFQVGGEPLLRFRRVPATVMSWNTANSVTTVAWSMMR